MTTRIRRDSTMKTRQDTGTPDAAAGGRQPRRTRSGPVAGTLAAALLGLGLLVAGCSSTPASGSGTGQAMIQGDQALVSFTRCMRSHGVEMSDPHHRPGHAGLSIDFPPQDAANRTAYAACNRYVAPFVQAKQAAAAAQSAPHLAALTRYAECMRARNIPLLDPNQEGQVDMGNLPGMLDSISRYSPQFRSADAACRNLLPAGVTDDGSGP